MSASIKGICLPFDEASLFKHIEECHHVGAVNREGLCEVLLGCLTNGFEQQQNPIVGGMQFPGAQHLRKLAARLSSQAAQQIGLIGKQALRQGANNACIQRLLLL
jgi:hypothetical protein